MGHGTAHKRVLMPQDLGVMVERRLRELPMIEAMVQHDAAGSLQIGAVRPHERDAHGRNWNIEFFRCGSGHWPQCQTEFGAIVDRLRDQFDLG